MVLQAINGRGRKIKSSLIRSGKSKKAKLKKGLGKIDSIERAAIDRYEGR